MEHHAVSPTGARSDTTEVSVAVHDHLKRIRLFADILNYLNACYWTINHAVFIDNNRFFAYRGTCKVKARVAPRSIGSAHEFMWLSSQEEDICGPTYNFFTDDEICGWDMVEDLTKLMKDELDEIKGGWGEARRELEDVQDRLRKWASLFNGWS